MVVTIHSSIRVRVDEESLPDQIIISVNGGFLSIAEGEYEFISTQEMLDIGNMVTNNKHGQNFVNRLLGLND